MRCRRRGGGRSRCGRRRGALGDEPIYFVEDVFRCGELWGESQHGFEVLLGALEIVFAAISVGPAEEGVRIVGIDLDRLVVIGDGPIEIALGLIDGAAIDVC